MTIGFVSVRVVPGPEPGQTESPDRHQVERQTLTIMVSPNPYVPDDPKLAGCIQRSFGRSRADSRVGHRELLRPGLAVPHAETNEDGVVEVTLPVMRSGQVKTVGPLLSLLILCGEGRPNPI